MLIIVILIPKIVIKVRIVTVLYVFDPVTFTHVVCYPYTPSSWDHAENEDEHLISQVASIVPVANNGGLNLDGEYRRHKYGSDRLTNHISNVSNNILNLSETRVSTLSIRYIEYFYHVFPLHVNTFPNLFPESFITFIKNLKNYIDCSLDKFRSCLNYFSSTFSCLTSQISDIQAIASLVTDLPALIGEVPTELKEAIESNMKVLSSKITEIDNSIEGFNKEIHESIKIIDCLNGLITSKCKSVIIKSFEACLKKIRCNLKELWSEFIKLYPSYFLIKSLITQAQNIIKDNKNNISTLKTKILRLKEKSECSLTQFKTIESKIECAKQKIQKITQLKQDLCKEFDKINLVACISKKGNSINVVIIYVHDIKSKIESLVDKIDKLCPEFNKITELSFKPEQITKICQETAKTEISNFGLKDLLIFNCCFFQIASDILEHLASIETSVGSITGKKSELETIGLSISLISNNITHIKVVTDMVNERRDDLQYLRDGLCSIIPNLCEIKKTAESIIGLGCVVAPLNNIKTSIENLEKIDSEIECLETLDLFDSEILKEALTCIKEKLKIKTITDKATTVTSGITSLQSVITINKKIETRMELYIHDINYALKWIEEVNDILDNVIKRFIVCSLKSLSNHLKTDNRYQTGLIQNDPMMINYSILNVTNYKTVIDRLFDIYNKVDRIFKLVFWTSGCKCIKSLDPTKFVNLETMSFYDIVDNFLKKSQKEFKKSVKLDRIKKINDLYSGSNHFCLCIVNKYLLYPQIVKLVYFVALDFEILSTTDRRFQKYPYSRSSNLSINNFLNVCVNLLYKVALYISLKYKYIRNDGKEQVGKECFCKYSEDPYYSYLISIILWVSSLIEKIWAMDNHAIVTGINSLSSLLSEYQSIHVYTNYGFGNPISGNLSGSTTTQDSNLSQITLSHMINMTSTINIKKNPSSGGGQGSGGNSSGNSNDNLQILLHTGIGSSQTILVKNGPKLFFKTVILGLAILIKTPLFQLAYSNISGLSFYLFSRGGKIGFSSSFMRPVLTSIAFKYLSSSQQPQQQCSCPKNEECKSCVCAKIIYLSLYITLNIIRYILGTFIKKVIVDDLKKTSEIKIHFVFNSFINVNIVALTMVKNINLAHQENSYHKNIANSFPGLTMGYVNAVYHRSEC